MSTKQLAQRIGAKAKATYAARKAESKSKSNTKPVFATGNSVKTEPVKPKALLPQKRHRYSPEEWAEICKRRNSQRTEGCEHSHARLQVAEGGWATMGKAGKTRLVNKSESGEIWIATEPVISEPVPVKLPITASNKRGWAQVAYQVPETSHRKSKTQSGPRLDLSGSQVSNTKTPLAVRKSRGWVTRVSRVAGCSQNQAQVELEMAVSDCNGRPGSARSRAILSAAANREISHEMPTSQNPFGILGNQADHESFFPALLGKKTEKPKNLETLPPSTKEEVVDTAGMDEIDAALALIEAERRKRISKKVAKARSKLGEGEKPLTPKTKPNSTKSAWATKSAWVKNPESKEPLAIPRKVTFTEAEVFTFDDMDIEGQDHEWQENIAGREYDNSWFGSDDEETGLGANGYPVGMTDWGEQAAWDEEHGN